MAFREAVCAVCTMPESLVLGMTQPVCMHAHNANMHAQRTRCTSNLLLHLLGACPVLALQLPYPPRVSCC